MIAAQAAFISNVVSSLALRNHSSSKLEDIAQALFCVFVAQEIVSSVAYGSGIILKYTTYGSLRMAVAVESESCQESQLADYHDPK